ncbi:MAG: HlyD family efflux transporter periplasmic adaptor subunit [Candidatus Omnitrophica bacterium COP1]|nr:efflux RND transporter periplasmic adaptor subunit [bacterium]MCE7908535.1 HlyD family efflux transporter periplasmic adaptor subunit [Candidatus Omnitrophica bacterium COP1]
MAIIQKYQRSSFAVLFVTCSSLLIFSGCTREIPPEPPPETKKVRVLAVQPSSAQPYLEINGSVVSQEIAHIHSEVTGLVQKVLVREGDAVSAGEVLAELDPVDFQLNLSIATAERERAQADFERKSRGYRPEDVDTIRARLENARALYLLEETNLDRNRTLHDSGVMTDRDWVVFQKRLDAAKALVNSASAELAKMLAGYETYDIQEASATLSLARSREKLAQRDLEQTHIRSPIKGVVTRRAVETGQQVASMDNIFEIQDPDLVWLFAEIGEKNASRIDIGQAAEIHSDATGSLAPGRVARLGKALNFSTHSLPLWIAWKETIDLPPIGSFAYARINLDPLPESYTLQRQWVHLNDESHFVWVVLDGTLSQRKVAIVEDHGDEVVIRVGLEPGTPVVVSPPSDFRVGMAVEVQPYIPIGTDGVSPAPSLSLSDMKSY